jgi:hypothetical protein
MYINKYAHIHTTCKVLWRYYCPTIRDHMCSWDKFSVHSLLHSSATGHSTALKPFSRLFCTALNFAPLTGRLTNLPSTQFYRHVTRSEESYSSCRQPRATSSADRFPEHSRYDERRAQARRRYIEGLHSYLPNTKATSCNRHTCIRMCRRKETTRRTLDVDGG